MPSPLRFLLPKSPIFITTRTEEGLPLIPAVFMNHILEGILARAQSLYPVKICGFKFMSNHLHMLLVVENPDDVVGFMDRVKTESAHAINHLLGIRRRTVWQKRYDSPIVLTPEDVVSKLIYLYTNAQTANLISCIDDYPNVCSWQMLIKKTFQKKCRWIRRPAIPKLENTNLTTREQQALSRRLLKSAKEEHLLTLTPDAWLSYFSITDPKEIAEYRRRIVEGVRAQEQALSAKRLALGKEVMGRDALLNQPIDTPYRPTTFGRRMWCICCDKTLKIRFILFLKELITKAHGVLKEWRKGNMAAKYPPGLFPPSMPKICNILLPTFA